MINKQTTVTLSSFLTKMKNHVPQFLFSHVPYILLLLTSFHSFWYPHFSILFKCVNFWYLQHWNAIICILKNIKGFPEKCLFRGHNNHTKVVYNSDVDWRRSPFDRRSTFKYCIFIGDNIISWKSKK